MRQARNAKRPAAVQGARALGGGRRIVLTGDDPLRMRQAMRRSTLLTALTSVALTSAVVAAPAPRQRPAPVRDEGLKLVLRLDRLEYLEREPILAEWTLTNTSRHALQLPGYVRGSVRYE